MSFIPARPMSGSRALVTGSIYLHVNLAVPDLRPRPFNQAPVKPNPPPFLLLLYTTHIITTMTSESEIFQQEVAAVEAWWKVQRSFYRYPSLDLPRGYLFRATLRCKQPRFAGVKRPYTASQVVAKRGTLAINYPSDVQGKKLWKILTEHAKNGTPSHTYGA